MTSLFVAVRIWAKTVAMNAILWGIGGVLTGEFYELLMAVVFLIGGFIVTLPLLMLISPLVKVSACIPYRIPAKIAWLTFSLAILIFIIYVFVSIAAHSQVFKADSPVNWVLGTTLAGLLFAVLTTGKSLKKLYSAS